MFEREKRKKNFRTKKIKNSHSLIFFFFLHKGLFFWGFHTFSSTSLYSRIIYLSWVFGIRISSFSLLSPEGFQLILPHLFYYWFIFLKFIYIFWLKKKQIIHFSDEFNWSSCSWKSKNKTMNRWINWALSNKKLAEKKKKYKSFCNSKRVLKLVIVPPFIDKRFQNSFTFEIKRTRRWMNKVNKE